jgi:NADH:ubiquinone oxidoreductase subunit 5 (subunit L)/multisubunit Na+/H+ antiporter MnhA subunit
MKKLIIKSYCVIISVGFLFMLVGRYYPDETATDNNVAAGIYIVAAVFFLLAGIGAILSLFKKK